jgi:hypothetical protein
MMKVVQIAWGLSPTGGCHDGEPSGHKGDPYREEIKLAYFPLCRGAVELLSDPVVSTERLSSVFPVSSVRAVLFLRALRVLRG